MGMRVSKDPGTETSGLLCGKGCSGLALGDPLLVEAALLAYSGSKASCLPIPPTGKLCLPTTRPFIRMYTFSASV